MIDPHSVNWNIQRTGRHWREDALARYELTPEKIEMVNGQLFWSDEDRLMMIGLLLENIGVDEVVRLGDPQIWRDAVNTLHK